MTNHCGIWHFFSKFFCDQNNWVNQKPAYFPHGTPEGCGPGSSVGIATELRAGRSGIESRWGRDFPPVQTDRGVHPASCTMGTESFLCIEAAGAWDWTPSQPHLVPKVLEKSRDIPLLTLRECVGFKKGCKPTYTRRINLLASELFF
jgi:hypothetical protein